MFVMHVKRPHWRVYVVVLKELGISSLRSTSPLKLVFIVVRKQAFVIGIPKIVEVGIGYIALLLYTHQLAIAVIKTRRSKIMQIQVRKLGYRLLVFHQTHPTYLLKPCKHRCTHVFYRQGIERVKVNHQFKILFHKFAEIYFPMRNFFFLTLVILFVSCQSSSVWCLRYLMYR